MWNIAIAAGIGLLLIIHGFAHWKVNTLWGTRPDAQSWLLGRSGASVGTALWVTALVSLLVAGFAAAFQLGWWRPLTVVATIVSLVVLVLFWNRRLLIGTGVDIGVLLGMVGLGWPPAELLGV
jgi:hypothetical protein